MFTAGRLSHRTRFRAMTYDVLDASAANLAYTQLVKQERLSATSWDAPSCA